MKFRLMLAFIVSLACAAMADAQQAAKVFKRGAIASPRHVLASAERHLTKATVPTQFAVVPKQLSM